MQRNPVRPARRMLAPVAWLAGASVLVLNLGGVLSAQQAPSQTKPSPRDLFISEQPFTPRSFEHGLHAVVNLRELAQREKRSPFTPRGRIEAKPRGEIFSQPGLADWSSFGAPSPVADQGPSLAGPAPLSPLPSSSFLGLDDDGTSIPPDTHGTVGPNHLLTISNQKVRVQDRSGNVLSTVTLDGFWAALGNPSCFDPKAFYDLYNDRFILVTMADSFSANSAVLLGVSQTGDPTGNWFLFRVDADATNVDWADYPSVGFNKDWIVVTANMFDNVIGVFDRVKLFVFNKAAVYANAPGAGTPTIINEPTGLSATMVPAITYDNTLATMYLVEVNLTGSTSSGLRVSTITGPLGAEVLTRGTALINTTNSWDNTQPGGRPAGSAPQLGSTAKIDVNDSRLQNVVYRNGNLWCAHTVFLPANNASRSAAQWWQFTPAGTLLQFGRVDDPTANLWYAFPSIAVNKNDDALLGFARFGAGQYASGNYAFRFGLDSAGTMENEVVLKAGEGPYDKFAQFGETRWGDYSSTVVDPVNDTDMWTIQEFAAAGNRFGTWWGKVDVMNLSPFRVEFAAATYTVAENTPGFATIAVNNIGGQAGSVDFATSDGTAIAGTDYTSSSGTLTFVSGQASTNFTVIVQDNFYQNNNSTVNLKLSNPQGGATLGQVTNAVLTIKDDESVPFVSTAGEFNFNYTVYFVTENETQIAPCGRDPYTFFPPEREAFGALITVTRTNGNTGKVLVDYAVTAGSAFPGIEFFPTNGTLYFDDYQMSTNFLVPVFSDFFPDGSSTINLALSNPRPAPEEEAQRPGFVAPKLGLNSQAIIAILEVNHGFFGTNQAFNIERAYYRSDEYPSANLAGTGIGVRTINIQIILMPPMVGPHTVQIRAFPGGQYGYPAVAGSDYAEAVPFNHPQPTITDPAISFPASGDYQGFDWTTITFPGGLPPFCRYNFTLTITNDSLVEFNEDLLFELRQPDPAQPQIGVNGFANVTILTDDPPAGSVDREWNPDDVEGTFPSFNAVPGANDVVEAVKAQPDGKTVLAGYFTGVNAIPRNRIARLNADGSHDNTFNPGTGADDFISALHLYTNGPFAGRILAAGGFSSMNGSQRNGIVRLLANGQVDNTFTPGNGAQDPNSPNGTGAVRALAVQQDGKILVVGDFTFFNDVPRSHLARLNPDGSLDTDFNVFPGANGTIWSLTLVPDGLGGEQVVIGGDFTAYNDVYRSGIARLNIDGSLDLNFDSGTGANGPVYGVGTQPNGLVVIGGAFSAIDLQSRAGVARLNSDGSLDATFDPGTGCNDTVYAVTIQPDGKPIIGGLFTSYNGTRRMGLARLRVDGSLDTSFLDTGYNQFAGFVNSFSFEPPNFVKTMALQPDGNVMVGGSFHQVGGHPSVNARLRNNYTVFTRGDKRIRQNIARLYGGATPGPGNIQFDRTDYFADENIGTNYMRLNRVDGRLGTALATSLTSNRLATAGVDYVEVFDPVAWPEYGSAAAPFTPISIGKVEPSYMAVPIIDDTLEEGDELVNLRFILPEGGITLGGENIPLGTALGQYKATLDIIDNDVRKGIFNFSQSNYFTNENAGFAVITVIRTNGNSGAVSVDYFTLNATNTPTAQAGLDYTAVRGTLSFSSGQNSRTFTVPIFNDNQVEFDENVTLVLTNATGGAHLPGFTNTAFVKANLAIIDDDYPPGRIQFASTNFAFNERDGVASIVLTRTGGNVGAASVRLRTVNGTAASPADYTATTVTVNWNGNDSANKTVDIPLVSDGLVEGTETVSLIIDTPLLAGVTQTNLLGTRTNATLNILDGDAYGTLAFNQSFYQADENGAPATITVVRSGGIGGTVSVDYATTADTAIPGTDYTDVSGTLTFAPGEISKSFIITPIDDTESDGNKAVIIQLSNPINAGLGALTNVTLTIIDNESFNIPAGSLDTTFNQNAQFDGPVFSLLRLPDNRFFVGGDFTSVNNVPRSRLARMTELGEVDPTFGSFGGPNDSVRALALQPDNKLLIGGFFSQVNNTNRANIARLNIDGTIDAFFNPGGGADNPVFALLVQPDERILVGGAFSKFNNITHPGVVRLNTNGTVDTSFNTGAGANATVYALAVQPNGQILIGGDFTQYNGVARRSLARLNANGTLDNNFNIGTGFDAAVRAILVQADGRIVVGGSFTNINGTVRNYLARLNPNGVVDATFLAGGLTGGDGSVYTLGEQIDGKIIVGGDFNRFNGVTRNRLTRLNQDGSTDPTINFGTGADSFVAALFVLPDRRITFGGGFTTYDDQPRKFIARIYGGSLFGPGSLEFSRPLYVVDENGTNALINVRRRGGTTGAVTADYATSDGTALAGTDYTATSGSLLWPQGETQQGFLVPIIDNFVVDVDRTVNLALSNYGGGATNAGQPYAQLLIKNDEALVGFASGFYSITERPVSTNATIRVVRLGGTNSTVSVNFATTLSGTATPGVDFVPTNGVLVFAPGVTSLNFDVTILPDVLIEPNETIGLTLTNLSGSNSLDIAAAILTVKDNNFAPGQLRFSSSTYFATETNGYAPITIIRTNGYTGVVSARLRATDNTAISGLDYISTNVIVSFADGEASKTIFIALLDDIFKDGDKVVDLTLSNPTGGGSLTTPNPARLTIRDNDVNLLAACGAALTSESIVPANNTIDPNEMVTVLLGICNIGTINSTNLVATLLASGGVTLPSGPQNYGAVIAGGSAVSRPFTFTAAGAIGSKLIATLLLTEGGTTNGSVTYEFTLGGRATVTFSNSTAITINDNGPATPFPSTIRVSGIGGTINKLTMTLNRLSHGYPDDIDMILAPPNETNALKMLMVMSDAGGGNSIPASAPVTLTFDDAAATFLPDALRITSGTYKPTNYVTVDASIPPELPRGPYGSTLSIFNGIDANGDWSLFVVDDSLQDSGAIESWSLSISTTDPVSPKADLGATVTGSAGVVLSGNALAYTIGITNYGPAAAASVVLTDTLPPGVGFGGASSSTGVVPQFNALAGTVTANFGTLNLGVGVSVTINVTAPVFGGDITNLAAVASAATDLNPGNNTAKVVTMVNGPSPSVPLLGCANVGHGVCLTWLASAGNFALESSTLLQPPSWQPVPVQPVVVNGSNTVVVPASISASKFYRLRQL